MDTSKPTIFCICTHQSSGRFLSLFRTLFELHGILGVGILSRKRPTRDRMPENPEISTEITSFVPKRLWSQFLCDSGSAWKRPKTGPISSSVVDVWRSLRSSCPNLLKTHEQLNIHEFYVLANLLSTFYFYESNLELSLLFWATHDYNIDLF